MASRQTFLTTRFGGYLHRDVPREDSELTHVGPGTPCGEYLRRYWQPVCFADELHDLPVRVTILGEELVVFRDLSSAVGLLELRCPHRGTSSEYGLAGAKGIRCCYHAWLFDVDGTILETPGEPAESTLKDRLCHGAYPTHEYNGIVFAYIGPPDQQPPFPVYDSFIRPGYRLLPGRKYVYPCNWLQIIENAMDPVHTAAAFAAFKMAVTPLVCVAMPARVSRPTLTTRSCACRQRRRRRRTHTCCVRPGGGWPRPTSRIRHWRLSDRGAGKTINRGRHRPDSLRNRYGMCRWGSGRPPRRPSRPGHSPPRWPLCGHPERRTGCASDAWLTSEFVVAPA
jgi:nitrite reductase/ring-hydroxylating ferredoxin subunit